MTARTTGRSGECVVPCLIPALKEQFVAPPKGVADVVGSVLTAGVLGVVSDTVSLLGRRDFDARKGHVLERLPVLARAYPGPRDEAWLDWAVCQGHTVDHVNLLQRLFFPGAPPGSGLPPGHTSSSRPKPRWA